MSDGIKESDGILDLQQKLKALGNRYAIEILQVLSPKTGDIIPSLGWEEIVDGVLELGGVSRPQDRPGGEKTKEEAEYEKRRQRFVTGGTLYETMNKLIQVGFVSAIGARGKKKRRFTITHDGRLALSAIGGMRGPTAVDTEIRRAAKTLLKHKNFIRLLPAQEKFLEEVGEVDSNLVIQMPPGSGKTFLAMIVILIRLQRGKRCLYLTPYTSLNTQVIDEYGELFETMGYPVVRHDGKHRATEAELEGASLVVGVLESVLSAVLARKPWTNHIGLVVVDELTELDSAVIRIEPQSLGTDRSAKLDCLVTQLKQNTQLITLSSRFGQTEEVARWLDAKVFRPRVRLTPDEFIAREDSNEIVIESSDGTQFSQLSVGNMLHAVLEHTGEYENNSILIVVGTRDAAEGIAADLAETHPRPIPDEIASMILGPERELPVTARLERSLARGVAFHHAGLDVAVRERLERSIKTGSVRTVVSTTGITSGISFPIDCVMIMFGTGMYFLVSRSRYLQIAGRIGEYHLARNGGRVYLMYEGPTLQFRSLEELEDTLLHSPLRPLRPGSLHPSLIASLLMREAVLGRGFTREKAEEKFLKLVGDTFRGSVDSEYRRKMKKIFSTLVDWLQENDVLKKSDGRFRISKEARSAVTSGINIVEYVASREVISSLRQDPDESELIELLLRFSLPQTLRPRAFVPTEIELRLAEIEPPDQRYRDFKKGRDQFKRLVLQGWLNEMIVEEVIEHAEARSREASGGRRSIGGDIGEGDLETLVGICSNIAWSLGRFLKAMKRRGLSRRLETFSKQLRHGVRNDLAESDLFDFRISVRDDAERRILSRLEARTLFDSGYKSIREIVRKDMDAKKPGFARDRFAKNCGLSQEIGKEVYKAALDNVKSMIDSD
ncbi:MAG: DEAD/DEAH box helicase [Candidatus Thorarchaeota archaeon]|jgi:helicase